MGVRVRVFFFPFFCRPRPLLRVIDINLMGMKHVSLRGYKKQRKQDRLRERERERVENEWSHCEFSMLELIFPRRTFWPKIDRLIGWSVFVN